MHILRHASEVLAFRHSVASIVSLLLDRLESVTAEGDAMEDVVFFIVLDAGDGVADIEAAMQSALMTESGLPLWEVIEEHPDCYELVFVLDDSGYGAIVVAPRSDAAPTLLDLCRRHAYAP